MKASLLVAAVVAIHVVLIGGVMVMQGCETRRPTVTPTPPPAPVMPPSTEVPAPVPPRPLFQPPVPVEPAPAVLGPGVGREYVVQSGDSLSKIAARVGVSMRALVELNKIKDPNHIRAGQKLILPEYAKEPLVSPVAEKGKKPKAAEAEGAGTYTIQPGDSLSKIAAKYGTTVSALREANNLTGDMILAGKKLVIPGAKPEKEKKPKEAEKAPEKAAEKPAEKAAPAVKGEPPPAPVVSEPKITTEEPPVDYVVQPGDTVDSIAKMYLIKKDQILKLNNLSEGAELKPGQKIKIPTM